MLLTLLVFHPEGTGIQRLEEGFRYFRYWASDLVDTNEFEGGVESKKFIAWQVMKLPDEYNHVLLFPYVYGGWHDFILSFALQWNHTIWDCKKCPD